MTIKVQEVTSESPYGVIAYASKKPDAKLISSSLFSDPNDLRACSKEMLDRMRLGKGKVKMLHIIVSEHPDDHLSPEQDCEVVEAVVQHYSNSARHPVATAAECNALWLAFKHKDRRHEHQHILLPVVGADGKMFDRSMERVHLRNLAKRFEAKWAITATPLFSDRPSHFSKPEIEKGHRLCFEGKKLTPCPERMDLRATLQAIAPAARSFVELETILSEHGITVHYRRNEAGKLIGISFGQGDVRITGKNAGLNFRELEQIYGNEANEINRITGPGGLAPTSPAAGESHRKGIGALDPVCPRQTKLPSVGAKHTTWHNRQATRPEYGDDRSLLEATQSLFRQVTGAKPRKDPLMILIQLILGPLSDLCEQNDRRMRPSHRQTESL